MLQPFGELTNRTPSPSQQEDNRYARKHSPWTAARHKKKTRSVQNNVLNDPSEPSACCASPDALFDIGRIAEDIEREYSLSDGLSSGTSGTGVSPHSSPPIDREQDAQVHPAKAYIVDQQAASPEMLSKHSDAASGKSRSPVWFGSTALQQELDEAREGDVHDEHSSSAPSTLLLDRFDAIGQQQSDIGRMQCEQQAPQTCLQGVQQMIQYQQAPAASAAPGRRRGLVARRRSWAGAEACRAPAAANGLGISRLAASTLAGHNSSNQSVVQAAAAGLAAVAAGQKQQDTSSYAVRSMLGLGSRCQRLDFDDDSEGFSIKQLPWDACNILQQDEVGCDYKLAAAGQLTAGVTHDSLDWFEQQLAQAAEEDDLATAQQLWSAMQSTGLKPNHKVITSYLLCCHYGGGDPVDAEQVVREMCAAADTEPDAVMLQLLASIDMAWQQLHCGL